ncbi:probable protein phosphatase 2C 44 isoform X1 [Musa acuminata AAA Group]|uniref:probable protein phosphatase 2C 44 isoform X1 n=2 Tax=Musa acuminata AAA Group TaxID=214697 RepID=UPI0031D43524
MKRSEFINIIKSTACLNTSSADTGKGRSKLSSTKVSHGFHLVKGKSGHDMEDYHVAKYRYEKNHELGLFAIFDGHFGDSVPSFLQATLFDNILKEPLFWSDPKSAIKNAYCSTNNAILENSKHLGPGGSTAVTVIVVDGKDLWIANIGDSRAVLSERGAAKQLTVDHEPHVERSRIEKQGGFVTIFPGDVPRVNGQLAVARAFGDQSLKAHLSSEPDVRHVPIDSTTEFVILASDGLWKVINNQEAVDLVKSIKDPQAAAKRLTTEALARKSKDDISCIMIRFRC